jgi:hypothetical protein
MHICTHQHVVDEGVWATDDGEADGFDHGGDTGAEEDDFATRGGKGRERELEGVEVEEGIEEVEVEVDLHDLEENEKDDV